MTVKEIALKLYIDSFSATNVLNRDGNSKLRTNNERAVDCIEAAEAFEAEFLNRQNLKSEAYG
jgi:hypothetical protein